MTTKELLRGKAAEEQFEILQRADGLFPDLRGRDYGGPVSEALALTVPRACLACHGTNIYCAHRFKGVRAGEAQ